VRALAGVCNQAHAMEVKQAVLVAKEVQLHPWDGGQRDKTKATYTFRLLQAPPDHIDYDAGQEMWLAALVAQIQTAYPADGNQWGEVHPLAQPRASGTQAEFEDGAKACLALLGRQGTTRLQNYVTNFHAAKQLSIERAERSKAEAAAEAQQAAKTQEEERVKAEKATPVFPEHVLIDLLSALQKKTGYQVFPVQINNAQCATKMYDFARRNKLPLTPQHLPDSGQPLTGTDGVVCGNAARVLHTAAGEGAVSITLTEDGGLGDAKGGDSHIQAPTSIAGVHSNTSRWFLTLLVVAQHLPEAAPFKMSPQATLAYLGMLWQVAMYRGMTLKKYTVYRDESLRAITTIYNQGERHMDDVLATAQRALYEDMSQYVKLYTHDPPAVLDTTGESKGAPGAGAEAEGDKYEALMLKYTELRRDHTARGKRVSELETETARLRRDLRDRSEYGLHRHRGGRDRGGRDRERDGARAWDTERNSGGERGREKRQSSPTEGAGAEPAKR